eukprot:510561_1
MHDQSEEDQRLGRRITFFIVIACAAAVALLCVLNTQKKIGDQHREIEYLSNVTNATNATVVSSIRSLQSSIASLPDDVKRLILRYSICSKRLLYYYLDSYRTMNETERKQMNKYIRRRIYDQEFTFMQYLHLSSFLLRKQPLDDDTNRVQSDAIRMIRQFIMEQGLNHHFIHNHTSVYLSDFRLSIRFLCKAKIIFDTLRMLGINVNGTLSLQTLIGIRYDVPLNEITYLGLDGNDIYSLDLFSDWTECKSLESLDLALNKLTDVDGLSAINESQLEEINLSGNKLTNIEGLRGFNKLVSLELNDNNIKDIEPLAGLRSLRQLELQGNNISDLPPLSGLRELKRLRLAQNNIENIEPLSTLNETLDTLTLAFNKITDIRALGALKRLGDLSLAGNRISDIEPLAALKELKGLDLEYTNVNLSNIVHLFQNRTLRHSLYYRFDWPFCYSRTIL